MIGFEAWLRSVGRTVRILAVVLAVLVAGGLVLFAHHGPPGPVQLTRAQYCGPVPSYYPGAHRGPRPPGC